MGALDPAESELASPMPPTAILVAQGSSPQLAAFRKKTQ